MTNITRTENLIDKIVESKYFVLFVISIFLVVSIILTSLQKKEYSSQARVLIIQDQEQKIDAYIASKASESIAKNLKKALSSSSFRNKVLENFSDANTNFSNSSEKARRKQWIKTLNVKLLPNSSILEITAYNESPVFSEKLLNNVLLSLLENHQSYHGGGASINLQIIDYPLTSRYAVKPDWVLNLILSIILGLFFSASIISFFPNKAYNLNYLLYPKKKRAKQIQETKKIFETSSPNEFEKKEPQSTNIYQNLSEEIKRDAAGDIDIVYEIKNKVLDNDHYLRKKE